MSMHFENLWETCEQLHQEKNDVQLILDEVAMKLDLYRKIDQKSEISSDDKEKIKSRMLGEILLTITKLSLTDNINVFAALATAYKHHNIDQLSKKYSV